MADLLREFTCWNCKKYHHFKRLGKRLKTSQYQKSYTNELFGWGATKEMCEAGGAYMEEFMPGETLIPNKRKNK